MGLLAVKRLYPQLYVHLLLGEAGDSVEVSPGVRKTVADILAESETVRSRILTLCQSAVGVQLQDLTAAQVKALLAAILWLHGVVDAQGKVRPLASWIDQD